MGGGTMKTMQNVPLRAQAKCPPAGRTGKMQKLILLVALFTISCSLFTSVFAQEGLIATLNFKDADIRVVLQAIAQKAIRQGEMVNIVVAPEVQGLVTVHLKNVDWETALNVVLKTHEYGISKYKNVIIVAPLEKIKEREAQEKERQGVEPSQLRVFKLNYLDANDAKRTIEPLLSPIGKISVLEATGQAGWEFGTDVTKRKRAQEGKVSRTKILVVSDISKKLDEIDALLSKIDVMPKQILIKARIVEVEGDLLKDIGFDWGLGKTGAEDETTIDYISANKKNGVSIAEMALHGISPTPSAFVPKATGLSADNFQFVYKKLTGSQFEVIFHALEEDARTNTLSAPTILTLDNQEASILVGTKYPIIKTEISTETSQVTGGSLDYYQDIGIQLNVVPQISGENSEFINMIIHPAVTSTSSSVEVTASNGNTAIVTYPIINSREAETQVMVKDNETIVIGGLLKDVKTKQEIGVPILKDLPVLGWFFRRNTYDTGKIDLLIFITAKIVKPGEAVTKEDLATNVSLESKK